jgi:hypothetical protein
LNITVGEKYLITSDQQNVILNEKYQKKDETFEYKQIGFFSKLEHACNFILEREINKSDAESIMSLLKVILQTREDILIALGGHNGQKIK